MKYTVRPLSDRTAFTGKHADSRFATTWSGCVELLERELDMLNARDIVIEVDVPERGIRLDGQLRADAKATSPAVRLAFDSKHGPLTYATDRFVRPSWRRNVMADDWQHNLYAIASSLEALRKVDRYGVTKRGEQYAGWKAIGSGAATEMPAGLSRDAAGELLYRVGECDVYQPPEVAHRRARARAHPDRNGGDRTTWDLVEQAAKVLGVLS